MKRALALLFAALLAVGCSRGNTTETNDRGGTKVIVEPDFTEPEPGVYGPLMQAVNEYFHYRKQAVLQGDVSVLWARYPELEQGADPGSGVNAEASHWAGYGSTRPVDGNINPTSYERMRAKLDGDSAQVLLHGTELYLQPNYTESGGEFYLKLYLQRRGGWTVVQTDEVTLAELHALMEDHAPAAPPVAKDCGAEELKHGVGRNQGARDCLWQAYQNGETATFTSSHLTVEGDPIIWTVNLAARNRILVSVDTRQDKFGEQKVTTYTCKALQLTQPKGGAEMFVLTGCTGGENQELGL